MLTKMFLLYAYWAEQESWRKLWIQEQNYLAG